MFFSSFLFLMSFARCQPSIKGISISRKAIVKGSPFFSARTRNSIAFCAEETVFMFLIPAWNKIFAREAEASELSSTIKTFSFFKAQRASALLNSSNSGAGEKGIVNQKQEPPSFGEATPIFPFIKFTRFLQMERPSPVPPNFL